MPTWANLDGMVRPAAIEAGGRTISFSRKVVTGQNIARWARPEPMNCVFRFGGNARDDRGFIAV
jgi:hypothetical protein